MAIDDDDARRRDNTLWLAQLGRESDDAQALDVLFVAARNELAELAARIMREERRSHTLQPTALMHEAYLRLFDVDCLQVNDRIHFLNLAARVMRRVLVEHARRRNSVKRGRGWRAVTLTGAAISDLRDEIGVLEMNDALEKLSELDPRAAEVVEKRIFGGLTMDEIADLMGLSRRTVQKDWRFATLWLRKEFLGVSDMSP